MIQIRLLAQPDLSLVRTWMRNAPEAPAWSDDDLSGLAHVAPSTQRKTRRAWVAEDASGLSGLAVATSLSLPDAPAECELELVLVPPHARRQGIGSALVHTVFAWARGSGAAELWLEVRESNVPALRLYEQCGFIVAGRRAGYYVDPVEDAVLMRRHLDRGSGHTPV
jgi:[ribosomal protein S18]-alanine N-acetyltransferase